MYCVIWQVTTRLLAAWQRFHFLAGPRRQALHTYIGERVKQVSLLTRSLSRPMACTGIMVDDTYYSLVLYSNNSQVMSYHTRGVFLSHSSYSFYTRTRLLIFGLQISLCGGDVILLTSFGSLHRASLSNGSSPRPISLSHLQPVMKAQITKV